MSTPASIASGVGFRHCQILAISTEGYPASVTTTAYEGVEVSGVDTLTITDPEPEQKVHVGDDRPFALDVLPATTVMKGQMTVAKENNTVDALLSGVSEVTVGEAKMLPIGTDKKGNESQVTVLAYRQSLDADSASATYGKRIWQWRLFPKAFVYPLEGSFDANPEKRTYSVNPGFCTAYPWGVSFSTTTEGCVQAQALRGISEYKPKIVAFQGNNTATSFSLPASYPAVTTAKIAVWVNGVLNTSATKTTTAIQISAAPTTGADVVVFYEHA